MEAPRNLTLPWPSSESVAFPVTVIPDQEGGKLDITLTPSPKSHPGGKGHAIRISVQVEVGGFRAPSPTPALLVVALLACALLAARTRRA